MNEEQPGFAKSGCDPSAARMDCSRHSLTLVTGSDSFRLAVQLCFPGRRGLEFAMRRTSLCSAMVILCWIGVIPSALAGPLLGYDRCWTIYFAGQSNVPAPVTELLATKKDIAARACVDDKGKVVGYSSIYAVMKGELGVCLFGEDPQNTATIVQMFPARSDCPRQDDPRYVATRDITEGTFLAITNWVDGLLSSRRALDRSLSIPKSDTRLREFADEFRATLPNAGLKLTSISVHFYDYEARLSEPNGYSGWILYVDWTPQGLKIHDIWRFVGLPPL